MILADAAILYGMLMGIYPQTLQFYTDDCKLYHVKYLWNLWNYLWCCVHIFRFG